MSVFVLRLNKYYLSPCMKQDVHDFVFISEPIYLFPKIDFVRFFILCFDIHNKYS